MIARVILVIILVKPHPIRFEMRSLWLIVAGHVFFVSIVIGCVSLNHIAMAASEILQPLAEISILTHPHRNTTNTKAKFTFASTKPVKIKCRIDSESYSVCTSPKKYAELSTGKHTFCVNSICSSGAEDSKPAVYSWTISSKPDTGTTQLLEEDYILLLSNTSICNQKHLLFANRFGV